MKDLLRKIDTYKDILDQTPKRESAESLREYYRLNSTYTSNAIEGNTLNLSETKIAIEDGLTVGGKPIKDYYEATGHADAFDFMYDLAQGNASVVTEENICKLHQIFYQKIDVSKAGKYKIVQNYISGSEHMTTRPERVQQEMKQLQRWAEEEENKYHPVEFAALIHQKLVYIHPFEDGNGRTARLLMNLYLLNKGFPIVTIPPIMRTEYIGALESGWSGSPKKFISLIAECELESLRDRFRMLEIPFPKLHSGMKR